MPLNSTKAFCLCGPQGTPEIKEHYIDSKKDVDRHLKFSCEQFIQQQTQIFMGNLEEFLTRVIIGANPVSKCSGSSWPVRGPWLITWFSPLYSELILKYPGLCASSSGFTVTPEQITFFVLFPSYKVDLFWPSLHPGRSSENDGHRRRPNVHAVSATLGAAR